MDISSMEFTSNDGTDVQKYNARLKALLLTPEATLPGSRGFGLARDFLEAQLDEAINILAIELAEKVDEFIPEIEVMSVEGDVSGMGSLALTIYIGRRV